MFNLESVYKAVLSHTDAVDISGDKEAKGSLRILKSALAENLISNISVHNNAVTAIAEGSGKVQFQGTDHSYVQRYE